MRKARGKGQGAKGYRLIIPSRLMPPGYNLGFIMETFSRSQQLVVLLVIFGMSLLYFHSINQPQSPQVGRAVPTLPYKLSQPVTDHRPLTTEKLSGAKLLTINKQINLNMATSQDLEAIPGIGQKTSEIIVAYRKKHGRFKKIEDIMKVPGIKKKRFEKIKRYLSVK